MRNRAMGLTMVLVAVLAVGCVETPIDPGQWDGDASIPATGGTGGTSSAPATSGPSTTGIAPSSISSGGAGGSGLPGTGGMMGTTCNGPAVKWQTSTVSLQANAFWIVADGQCYTSRGAAVEIHSDPGWSQYTSLELIWNELGREMRFLIYLHADSSLWWSEEMRTYNGQQPYSDWLFYYGKFFTSPIGQAFHGDINLTNDSQDTIRGELHLHGLTLSTTMTGK